MNLSKEKKVLKKLNSMLPDKSDLIGYLWMAGLIGFGLVICTLLALETENDRPYILALGDIVKEKLTVSGEIAATITTISVTVCSFILFMLLSWFVYFRRKLKRNNEAIQNFCRENQETLKVLFEEDWLEQKQVERKEINKQANTILKKLEEIVDPTEVRGTKKRLKKLAKKVDIAEVLR
jgi:hypothetical protein